jgi:hypothetical protein
MLPLLPALFLLLLPAFGPGGEVVPTGRNAQSAHAGLVAAHVFHWALQAIAEPTSAGFKAPRTDDFKRPAPVSEFRVPLPCEGFARFQRDRAGP